MKNHVILLTLRHALLVIALVLCGLAAPARAQIQLGQIQGTITNQDNGKPLSGVTVVVSGPALQGDQTEFTGADGRYLITQLPSGDNYMVRFYFNDVVVERPGVRVRQSTTLTISATMPTHKGQRREYVIHERAPNVDTTNTTVGVEINQEILQNTAVRGRSFESVIALAPGAVDPPRGVGGDIGVSISGSTGNENNFIIDGLNTTDPNLGLIGTQLNQYFIKEVNVITGGYQAEYGRATGGIVSIVTKTGSNEFHGGVFASWQPFSAGARTIARLGEAIGLRRTLSSEYDYGFELGGPIVKDRVWFYVGVAPTVTNFTTERTVRVRRPVKDASFECPGYLSDPLYCDGPRLLAYQTDEQPNRTQRVGESRTRYNWIAKLQFNFNADHNLQVEYLGAPESVDGYTGPGARDPIATLRSNLAAGKVSVNTQIHDIMTRYTGKLLDRRLQLEVMYGYHRQETDERPDAIDRPGIVYRARPTDPFSLADFEDVQECRRQTVMGASGTTMFNPCPITAYNANGYGRYQHPILERHVLLANATYYLKLLGTHAWKLGFDFEDVLNNNLRAYSGTDLDPNNPQAGHRLYRSSADGGSLQITREYANRAADGSPIPLNSFRGVTETRNYALYLRDSWNVSLLPGLTVNAGLRWEAQEIYGQNSKSKNISIYDNIAPRVGAAFDPTRKGRGKIYVNYGWFYESIPMDLNDRQFSSEGLLSTAYTSSCAKKALQPGGRAIPVPEGCTFTGNTLNGGAPGEVAPGLKGQYITEAVVGGQYDVGWDVVLGAAYIHRDLGNIIEDLSTDGGNYYIIANPGMAADAGEVSKLQAQINATKDATERANLQSKLDAYQAAGKIFPRAVRNYDALQIIANKRLSNRFAILANYTFSRTLGNYPGTFSPSNGQLDPNISSQFDLTDLLANRNGPLPSDRPHNFKATGYYTQPLGSKGTLVASLTFTAYSGRPIEVLGAHPAYGVREVFILPRGSGGRTPMVTQLDLHLGYEHQLSKLVRLSVYMDIVNLLNQQEVVNVDDEYTASVVGPIVDGQSKDLRRLRALDGSLPVPNSNYGQPTGYQAPLYMRLGGRLSF